jgi:hypothetical protein
MADADRSQRGLSRLQANTGAASPRGHCQDHPGTWERLFLSADWSTLGRQATFASSEPVSPRSSVQRIRTTSPG